MAELGVKGLSVLEVFSLFEGSISSENEPVGLILCLPFNDYAKSKSRSGALRDTAAAQPEGANSMFFCNQVIANACGTIALMHVIMNVNRDPTGPQCPGFDLGPELSRHLDFVEPLQPSVRGLCLSNDMFLRRVHNGFGNLPASMDFADEPVTVAEPEPSTTARSKRKKAADTDGDAAAAADTITQMLDSAFHFVALIPFHGRLWELDGLRADPTDLGTLPPADTKPWYNVALELIASRIDLDNPPDLNLLAIVPDPVPKLTKTAAAAEAEAAARELRHEKELRAQYEGERIRANFNYLPFYHDFLAEVAAERERSDVVARAIEEGFQAAEDKTK
ncbi:ubiquitin carboxyl-terminal hydrolase [Catenaria anguillulae PL171]|uniref:ubiquitinyl hydrolase 1 n=1 Tax=Catenaria anguillulae PL171 TaxID=765915 RepID=A0A1Y2HSR2_9FUNG|nr:ubiquitin carboxyl-terminal hydrolase [Catenaria anguillulae PL171]